MTSQQLNDMVFDRTIADVKRVQALTAKLIADTATDDEKAEWLGNPKGAYNAVDLNRVSAAADYLASLLENMGYTVSVDTREWTESDFPTETEMEAYIANIHQLREVLPFAAPDAPKTAAFLTYEGANRIEEILYNLELILIAVQDAYLVRQAQTQFMIAGGLFNA